VADPARSESGGAALGDWRPGIGLAVTASLGQQTLRLEQSKTSPNLLGRVTFTHRVTQASVTYELPISPRDYAKHKQRRSD